MFVRDVPATPIKRVIFDPQRSLGQSFHTDIIIGWTTTITVSCFYTTRFCKFPLPVL